MGTTISTSLDNQVTIDGTCVVGKQGDGQKATNSAFRKMISLIFASFCSLITLFAFAIAKKKQWAAFPFLIVLGLVGYYVYNYIQLNNIKNDNPKC